MNIDALKKELKSFSKQKLIEEYKDLYLAHDMLKQTSIALNKQLDQANERLKYAIVPKFNKGDVVYALFTDAMVVRCQVDAFDYYTNSYLLFPNEDIGNEWIEASNVFKNKVEALAKIKK